MTDASHHPEWQIERSRSKPVERPVLESHVAQAEPAGGDALPVPEQSEQQQLQKVIADRAYEPQAEAQSKVAAAADVVYPIHCCPGIRVLEVPNEMPEM